MQTTALNNDASSSAPVVADDTMSISGTGRFVAVDAEDGTERWEYADPDIINHGFPEAPAGGRCCLHR